MTSTIYVVTNKTSSTVSLGKDQLVSTNPVYLREHQLTDRVIGMYERSIIDIVPPPIVGLASQPGGTPTPPPPVPATVPPGTPQDCGPVSGNNGIYTKPCCPPGAPVPVIYAKQAQRWPVAKS
jgi:hypothetical protein